MIRTVRPTIGRGSESLEPIRRCSTPNADRDHVVAGRRIFSRRHQPSAAGQVLDVVEEELVPVGQLRREAACPVHECREGHELPGRHRPLDFRVVDDLFDLRGRHILDVLGFQPESCRRGWISLDLIVRPQT